MFGTRSRHCARSHDDDPRVWKTDEQHPLFVHDKSKGAINRCSVFKGITYGQRQYLLRDIMIKDVVCIPGHLHQKEVAPLFDKNKLVAIPITTKHKHLLGVVQMNDIRKASTPKKRW